MFKMLNIFQRIFDFVDEKCEQLINFLIEILKSFPSVFQVLFVIIAAFLIVIGTITLIKKSAKLIIVIAAVLVIVLGISIFL